MLRSAFTPGSHVPVPVIAVALALAIAAAPLRAQGPVSVAVGAIGTLTRFDRTLGMEDRTGGGGRVAFAVGDVPVQLEGEVTWTESRSDSGTVTHLPVRVRLVHAMQRRGGTALILGAGAVWSRYRLSDEVATDRGVTALIGVALPLARNGAVRLDLTADRSVGGAPGRARAWNAALGAGVMFPLAKGRSKSRLDVTAVPMALPLPPPADHDRDGVSDSRDRCARTPAGSLVAANGCPYPASADSRPGVP